MRREFTAVGLILMAVVLVPISGGVPFAKSDELPNVDADAGNEATEQLAQVFRRRRRGGASTTPVQRPAEDPRAMFPGKSFRGELPKLSEAEAVLRDALKKDVQTLAGDIGPRNVGHYASYLKAAAFLEKSLKEAGHEVQRQTFTTRGRECYNLVVELPGGKLKDEIVVIGAHYDSAGNAPGANDNGSGVAAVLALARLLKGATPDRTVRLVLFANEEQPFFQGEAMGSSVYARACQRRKERVVAMLSLETLGYYSDAKGSQKYPAPLSLMYPSTGNFVGFVGNLSSRKLVGQAIGAFRRHAQFPSEAAALPGNMEGVGWSDHWSFWQCGYPAAMVTDTAFFRYPHYHLASDTPDKLDYERLARVVEGLGHVVRDLASAGQGKAQSP